METTDASNPMGLQQERNNMTGTLYGVGLGPGDPELITLKAHRLISTARVISYPAPDTGPSLARSIAASFIPEGIREIPVVIPMRESRFPAQEIYDQACSEIAGVLESGENVVCLCEGDPFFYGSYMYVFERLSPRFTSIVVPGVTSLTACAAALRRPLTSRTDVLSIIPGTLSDSEIEQRLEGAQSIAIMKVGRHLKRLRSLLERMNLLAQAGYVERASMSEQKVQPLACVTAEKAPYFSMILIYKGDEAWQLPPSSSF